MDARYAASSPHPQSMLITNPMVTTAFDLPGYRIVKNLGVVRGIIVRSRSVVGNFGASIQSLFGGNITILTSLCEQARGHAFDLMIEQLFAEVWTRPALDIPTRRLLSLGVLAAQGRFDLVGLQFERALRAGELTAEQIRESVIHLVAYCGYPASGQLLAVSEAAIAAAESVAP